MKIKTLVALCLLSASSLALAGREPPFKAADKNGDGKLDKNEAQAAMVVPEHFDEADANKDGFIDHDELRKYHRSDAYRNHVKGEQNFTKADKDKDGKLTKDEAKAIPNVSTNFDAIDVDKDGTVDSKEVHDFMMTQRKGGAGKK